MKVAPDDAELEAVIGRLNDLKKGWVTSQSFSKFIDRVVGTIRSLAAERIASKPADGLRAALRHTLYIGETIDGHPIAEKRTYTLQLRFETRDQMRNAADAIRRSQSLPQAKGDA